MVKLVHGYRIDHGCFLVVVFEDEDHVKVLELERDSLKMYQLYVLQGHNKWRLAEGKYINIKIVKDKDHKINDILKSIFEKVHNSFLFQAS